MDKKIKEPPTLNLNFPKDGKVQPAGFAGLGVAADVTIVIKGKITRIEENIEEWNPGKHLTLNIGSCDIYGPEKKISLDDAVKSAKMKL